MISRAVLTFRNGYFRTSLPVSSFVKRLISTVPSTTSSSETTISITDLPDPPVLRKDGPERDLVNFPPLKRAMYAGKVRLGFLPDEWFQFFHKKTGVTGPYLFGIGLVTFLVSKEFYVIDHEFHNGVSMVIVCYFLITKLGPKLRDYLETEIETEDKAQEDIKQGNMNSFAKGIENENKAQEYALVYKTLCEAKRENVLLQLEAEYRRRAVQVYDAFKRRLDFQLSMQESKKHVEQKHMVNWIVNSVMKSITPQQEADALKKCISDLKSLSASSQ